MPIKKKIRKPSQQELELQEHVKALLKRLDEQMGTNNRLQEVIREQDNRLRAAMIEKQQMETTIRTLCRIYGTLE